MSWSGNWRIKFCRASCPVSDSATTLLRDCDWSGWKIYGNHSPTHLHELRYGPFLAMLPSLVGGWASPLKNMKINWMIIPNMWEKKKCSKPPTRLIWLILWYYMANSIADYVFLVHRYPRLHHITTSPSWLAQAMQPQHALHERFYTERLLWSIILLIDMFM